MKKETEEKAAWRVQRRQELLLPAYSMFEEVLNAVTHGGGAVLAVVGLAVLLMNAPNDMLTRISIWVFGLAMILLYTVSAIYHGIDVCAGKKVLRVLDHCTIFVLIAGTYTPIALLCFGGSTGWLMFGIVWGVALLGIILNAIDLQRFKTFSMVCYIGLGWLVLFFIKPLIEHLDQRSIIFLIAGGVFYTVGAILYGIGKKVKYMHSIWHLFVLAGTIFHYFVIYHIAV